VLPEGQQAIITQFGKPVGQNIVDAGLKLKVPFIQKIHRFEKRILEWDGYPNQVPTGDKKFIWLDTTARWRIVNTLKFYESLGTEDFAQSRLDDIIDSAARDSITGQDLIEVVRNSNRILEPGIVALETEGENREPNERIEIGRRTITQQILEKVQETVPQFGIELVDMQIKRINYIDEVREKVDERMSSERLSAAQKYRSEGEGEAASILGQMQKELKSIQSEAYKTAEQIRGDADAKAIRIYANAHNRDPEFYSFVETLRTYSHTLNNRTTVILSTNSDLYKYLRRK
jgi:membrane protease subunit HflC